MSSAEPARPPMTTGRSGASRVQASALASYQLVEDARHRTPDRVRKKQRERARNEQTVAARLVAREFERE